MTLDFTPNKVSLKIIQDAEILVVSFCFEVHLRKKFTDKKLFSHFSVQLLFLSFSPREILSELRYIHAQTFVWEFV
jgi:hypothetical protein